MAAVYNRVILSGLIGGVQTWSVGMSFGTSSGIVPGVSTYDDLLAWATAIGALNGGHIFDSEIGVALGTITSIAKVRTETVAADGTLTDAAEFNQAPAYFGSGTVHMPPQSAIVASLETGRPGRSFRGRIYWPALGFPIQPNTGRIDITDATSIATSTATLLGDIASAAPGGAALIPVIASAKLGEQTPITSVAVGTVVDTQRRRRDKLVEQYASVSYTG